MLVVPKRSRDAAVLLLCQLDVDLAGRRRPRRVADVSGAQGLRARPAIERSSAILCVQNMEHLDVVSAAAAKVLKPGGRMLWVVNHPAFRIPRQTSWGNDAASKIQYRRIDAYSSTLSIPIIMHPGRPDSETTTSFHRSLQTLTATGFSAGLRLAGIEEWYSHKESQPGPRAGAENRARKEFPLFLALLWEKR